MVTMGIDACVEKLVPMPASDQSPLIHCGLQNLGYYNIPDEVDEKSVKMLCKLVNLVAMHKPQSDRQKFKDANFFGRLFPNEEIHEQLGRSGQQRSSFEIVRVNRLIYKKPHDMLENTTLAGDGSQQRQVRFFEHHADAIADKTLQLASSDRLRYFPSKTIVILKRSAAAATLFEKLATKLVHAEDEVWKKFHRVGSWTPRAEAGPSNAKATKFALYCGVTQLNAFNDANDLDVSHILVVSYTEAGRGVDFKNVRSLIKFGVFTYEENIQMDGRINRINAIEETKLDALETLDRDTARTINIYFLLPRWDATQVVSSERSKNLINCYEISYAYLQSYVTYYNDLFRFLKDWSFLADVIRVRLEDASDKQISQDF